jgi:hypothetical protein
VRAKYEGRSINKLQNGAIPLFLEIGNIQNIRFARIGVTRKKTNKLNKLNLFASDTEVQLVVHQWLGQQPASFFASGIQKLVDRWDKCLNELGRYVEK